MCKLQNCFYCCIFIFLYSTSKVELYVRKTNCCHKVKFTFLLNLSNHEYLQKYNEFWWVGRVVKEGSSAGYVPTPEYLEILRRTKKLPKPYNDSAETTGRIICYFQL